MHLHIVSLNTHYPVLQKLLVLSAVVSSGRLRMEKVMQHFRCLFITYCRSSRLFLNRLDTVPSTTQSLLPQADPVVTGADSQNVAAQAPANTPSSGIDVEHSRFPVIYIQLAHIFQGRVGYVRRSEEVQMRTVLSWDAEAM